MDDDDARPRVGQGVRDVLEPGQQVDGQRDHPGLGGPEVGGDELPAVRGEDRDRFGLADAVLDQPVREAVGGGLELEIRPRTGLVGEGGAVRERGGRAGGDVPHGAAAGEGVVGRVDAGGVESHGVSRGSWEGEGNASL